MRALTCLADWLTHLFFIMPISTALKALHFSPVPNWVMCHHTDQLHGGLPSALLHSLLSYCTDSCQDILLQSKMPVSLGARGKVRGSLKSMNICTKFSSNPSLFVEIFQSVPKWWTNTTFALTHDPPDSMAKKCMLIKQDRFLRSWNTTAVVQCWSHTVSLNLDLICSLSLWRWKLVKQWCCI